ncbi:MAG: exodeoxyribonuclease alpha subunit [Betaproteobacteria bacterium]|nr:exodeoxyribonuclease alpha subunit [Betaproteobacteria bacterium]
MAQPQRTETGEVELSDLDRHFGALMMRLSGHDDPQLGFAASLASRATGNGDVCVRLEEFAGRVVDTAVHPFDLIAPALKEWVQSLRRSSVVGQPGDFRPLVLDDKNRLYLYRYWDYEKRLADNVLARAVDADDVDGSLLREGLARYFPDEGDIEQKLAAAMAVMRRFCVLSGGPGTGKTSTVVKILALLVEQARGRKLAIGLAAPTGKAAARVQDAIRAALDRLGLDAIARESIPGEAFTLHRLLGARPDSVYYRHNRDNPLPLDVLVVDEASMADLALAAKLVEALPARARLILLGDKDQLASVEAGAVLGDVCASSGVSRAFAKRLAAVTAVPIAKISTVKAVASALSDSIALLNRSYRFGPQSGIGTLARLVNEGKGGEAVALLKAGTHKDVAWRAMTPGELRASLAGTAGDRLRAYFDGVRLSADPQSIFELFNEFRVLCAHRSGLLGVRAVNRIVEDVLEDQHLIAVHDTWYAGRPVMITRNDYNARLFNGDVGITLADADAEGRLKVFFQGGDEGLRAFAPARVPEHETVYAMTIHKSQGSEFGNVLMILPNEPSPTMSRELVYTGITRAMNHVEIWGNSTVFSDAVEHRFVRASALQERLWQREK